MHHRTTIAALSLFLAACLPAQAETAKILPEQIGQIFCIGSLGNDMSPVMPMLTPDLNALIENAFARSNEFEIAHPGDKPPMGDGVPWRSWQDYADGCMVVQTQVSEYTAKVTVAYSFTQSPEANYHNDLLLLIDEGGFWRIDDIDLGDGNSLRSALAAAFEQ